MAPEQQNLITAEYVLDALRTVMDPEVGMNIVDLGLIQHVDITPQQIRVDFTLTSPTCPLGEYIAEEIRRVVEAIAPDGVLVDAVYVMEAKWAPSRMSEAAKETLGWTAPDESGGRGERR